MKIGFVTDSTSDLPHHIIEQYEIEIVPSMLVIDGKTYADGAGITREDFYTRLPQMKSTPTTAAPSAGEFGERYQRLRDKGCEKIISIHPPAELTAIVNIARLAAKDFGDSITVIDSGSLSLGLGFQVLAAAEANENGASYDEILQTIQSTRERTFVTAALDTMEYLKRSGRVPAAVANFFGGLLSIKPMVELREGEIKAIGAVRTTNQADEKIINTLKNVGEMERLAILHTNAPVRAKKVMDALMETHRMNFPRDLLFVNVTTVIGTHVGPNGLGFAAIRKSYFENK